ncbi:MAG: tellurite resistance protein [Blastococcus sp.]|jgi:tellurite resistance protein|nr:tellurite resistance protein [Blastococcus sp.]
MTARTKPLPRRVPVNLFGIPFGLAGLGEVWTTLARYGSAPALVGEALLLLSAAVWLVLVLGYLRHLLARPRTVGADLRDPVAAPFASLVVITPMVLAGQGLSPHAALAAQVVTDTFLTLTVLLGGWFTGQWLYRPLDIDRFHPGYFLPTVAGGLIAAAAAGTVGQPRLGEIMLGLGGLCWILLGSVILGRLLLGPVLPPPLQPTLAIEVAPPAVASLAWFALRGDRIDVVAAVLAGYGLLMVLAQLPLLPVYLRLPFMPSTWSFTFSWAAVVTVALIWLQDGQPAGYRAWQFLLAAAISLLVAGIALRTAVALVRRQLLPPRPSANAPAGQAAVLIGAGAPES